MKFSQNRRLLLITVMGERDDSRVKFSVGGWYRPSNLHFGRLSGSSNLKNSNPRQKFRSIKTNRNPCDVEGILEWVSTRPQLTTLKLFMYSCTLYCWDVKYKRYICLDQDNSHKAESNDYNSSQSYCTANENLMVILQSFFLT